MKKIFIFLILVTGISPFKTASAFDFIKDIMIQLFADTAVSTINCIGDPKNCFKSSNSEKKSKDSEKKSKEKEEDYCYFAGIPIAGHIFLKYSRNWSW